MGIRQRPKQGIFHPTRNRGAGSDTQPQREHCHRRESRTLPQRSKGMPQILP